MATRNRRAGYGNPLVLAAMLICSCGRAAEPPQPSNATEASDMAGDSHVHHGIDYIEFAVTDMAESKRFYAAAFDWKFNDYGPEYAGIQGLGREVGGFRLEPTVATGGPLVILYSSDLDTTIRRVRDAGGRIVTEPFDFPGGRRFHFEDPNGNELAVWAEK